MREEGIRHPTPPRPPEQNPWGDGVADPAESTLARLSTTFPTLDHDDARADQYGEWAERLREKRRRVRQDQAGEPAPSYWTTAALFEESRRIQDDELGSRPNPWRVQELLAILDLRGEPKPAEIAEAYRRLAKAHHPDHYLEADPDIKKFHAEKMRAVNSAYHSLKQLQKT